jgi:hypothetical protein
MSYTINKTNGDLLTNVVDGEINQIASSLSLVGKNASSYGEIMNENFIRLLENFANGDSPIKPLAGQLWYDTNQSRLKIYDGTSWKVSSGTIVANPPQTLSRGELWIDSLRQQLYFNDGAATVLAGPNYTKDQGVSGFQTLDIVDINQINHTVVFLYVAKVLIGIFSQDTFTPLTKVVGWSGDTWDPTKSDYILGDRVIYLTQGKPLVYEVYTVSQTSPNINVVPAGTLPTNTVYWKEIKINPGFNSSQYRPVFDVLTSQASSLRAADGTLRTAEQFLSSTQNSTAIGRLEIQNSTPLILGPDSNNTITVSNSLFKLSSASNNQDYQISVFANNQETSALFINAETNQVGIFTGLPTATLDVNGDVRIRGNIVIEGATTSINATNLLVEDLLIEIGKVSSPSNTTANGGGISLEGGGDGDKTLTWNSTTEAWTSSEHINLGAGKSYHVEGFSVLSKTTLGQTVTNAPGLTTIGQLDELRVDYLRLNNNAISYVNPVVSDGDIVLQPKGTGLVNVSNARITGVSNPVAVDDAVNLTTLVSTVKSAPLGLSANFTGLTDNQIAGNIVAAVYLPGEHEEGTKVRVWGVDTSTLKTFVLTSGSWTIEI